MTPAQISVERLRELHAVAFQWPPRNLEKFADAIHEALPALLQQLAELERELHDAEHEVTIMERNVIAAERAREEACKIIAELRDYVVNERDAQVLPRKAASYQRELDSIDAFLAASGERVDG